MVQQHEQDEHGHGVAAASLSLIPSSSSAAAATTTTTTTTPPMDQVNPLYALAKHLQLEHLHTVQVDGEAIWQLSNKEDDATAADENDDDRHTRSLPSPPPSPPPPAHSTVATTSSSSAAAVAPSDTDINIEAGQRINGNVAQAPSLSPSATLMQEHVNGASPTQSQREEAGISRRINRLTAIPGSNANGTRTTADEERNGTETAVLSSEESTEHMSMMTTKSLPPSPISPAESALPIPSPPPNAAADLAPPIPLPSSTLRLASAAALSIPVTTATPSPSPPTAAATSSIPSSASLPSSSAPQRQPPLSLLLPLLALNDTRPTPSSETYFASPAPLLRSRSSSPSSSSSASAPLASSPTAAARVTNAAAGSSSVASAAAIVGGPSSLVGISVPAERGEPRPAGDRMRSSSSNSASASSGGSISGSGSRSRARQRTISQELEMDSTAAAAALSPSIILMPTSMSLPSLSHLRTNSPFSSAALPPLAPPSPVLASSPAMFFPPRSGSPSAFPPHMLSASSAPSPSAAAAPPSDDVAVSIARQATLIRKERDRAARDRRADADALATASASSAAASSATSVKRDLSPARHVGANPASSSSLAGGTAGAVAGAGGTTSGVSGSAAASPSTPVSGGGLSIGSLRRRSTRAGSGSTTRPLGVGVLVGNLIGQDHANYVLMYNMLTGIRVAVSRCQAKVKRPLTDDDYTARHKFSFDVVGNELTPSTKYDFKFKDYAPWVFRELRESFYLDPSDYLVSLTAKYILSELGSPGKSGSFFYFSRDYRFIIKTIRHSEHKFLRSILKEYHQFIKKNPHTLLSRFYGLHRVKLPRGRKIHFVIMNNLFPPHRDIHETYDLKGSSIGRIYPESLAINNPTAILKDLNWLHRSRYLCLGPEKKALFEEQLRRDTELLRRLSIIDYSLLTGVHNVVRGNVDNLRDGILSVFQPATTLPRSRSKSTTALAQQSTTALVRQSLARSDPQSLSALSPTSLSSPSAPSLPAMAAKTKENPLAETYDDRSEESRGRFLFYSDEGGIRASGEGDEELEVIYYLGIIDILTPYTCIKRLENFFRGFKYDRHMISAVPPAEYGDRFIRFIYSVIKGNDESKRPRMALDGIGRILSDGSGVGDLASIRRRKGLPALPVITAQDDDARSTVGEKGSGKEGDEKRGRRE